MQVGCISTILKALAAIVRMDTLTNGDFNHLTCFHKIMKSSWKEAGEDVVNITTSQTLNKVAANL